MKSVLTIAGSDSSGGAGIQADIKTIAAHKLFAQSVVTALTAQNTKGVFGVHDVPAAFICEQIDVVFDDIRPDAVKIGMVSVPSSIEVIAEGLKRHGAHNIVLDPVMVSTSGSTLLRDEALGPLIDRLFPLASVVTPNIDEAGALSDVTIVDRTSMVEAARHIADMTAGAVLLKGGHAQKTADDLLYIEGEEHWLEGVRIDNPNTHGTGCSLSSAIACGLAEGLSVLNACRCAKEYVAGALRSGLDLGAGSGPIDHMWRY